MSKPAAEPVTLHRNGKPLTGGDVPEGATVEFERATGKVVAIEPEPEPTDPLETFVTLGQAAQAVVDRAVAEAAPAKPKRQRKPKAGPTLGESCDALASALIQALPAAREAKEARMKALGFRRTGKQK